MSDFSELFTSSSDPKHLSPTAFIAKEFGNAETAVKRLPAELQPAATAVVNASRVIVTDGLQLAGDAVSAYLSANGDGLRGEVVKLLSGVTGGGPLTAATQDAIASGLSFLNAMVAHEVAQFQAVSAPPAPPVAGA